MRQSAGTLPSLITRIDEALVTEANLNGDGGVASMSTGELDWSVNFTTRDGFVKSFTVVDMNSGAFFRVSNAYQIPEYDRLCRLLVGQA